METFKSRVANLIARSRKALRLYSHAGRAGSASSFTTNGFGGKNSGANSNSANFSELQASQWREITAELLRDLTEAVSKNQPVKNLSADIFSIRDKFNSLWRAVEAEIHNKHKELISHSDRGEYVKAAVTSTGLVSLKAKYQAAQAAHHELEELIKAGNYTAQPIVLSSTDMLEEELNGRSTIEETKRSVNAREPLGLTGSGKPAKVIPIRKIL